MAVGIIQIDMHLRDERVATWIAQRADENGECRATWSEIAQEFRCTEMTAGNILKRLVGAGIIVVVAGSKRQGYRYKVIDETGRISA